MTEVELLGLNELPEHLIVMGGGYIGLEFGQMFQRFGAEVTIIAGSGVAGREDEDVSRHDRRDADRGGRPDRRGSAGPASDQREAGISVELGDGTSDHRIHLLVATGERRVQLGSAR